LTRWKTVIGAPRPLSSVAIGTYSALNHG